MKIGIWSDSVNFPNLPLMKLSTYHKELGDSVEFIEEGGVLRQSLSQQDFQFTSYL